MMWVSGEGVLIIMSSTWCILRTQPGKYLGQIKTVFGEKIHFFLLPLAEEEPNKFAVSPSSQKSLGKQRDFLLVHVQESDILILLTCYNKDNTTGTQLKLVSSCAHNIMYIFFSKKHLSALSINMALNMGILRITIPEYSNALVVIPMFLIF